MNENIMNKCGLMNIFVEKNANNGQTRKHTFWYIYIESPDKMSYIMYGKWICIMNKKKLKIQESSAGYISIDDIYLFWSFFKLSLSE